MCGHVTRNLKGHVTEVIHRTQGVGVNKNRNTGQIYEAQVDETNGQVMQQMQKGNKNIKQRTGNSNIKNCAKGVVVLASKIKMSAINDKSISST